MATAVLPQPAATPIPKRPRLPLATAAGLLALLSEPDPTLVQHALSKLLSVVDTLWHEIAECLPDLEAIAEGASPLSLLDDEDDADNNNINNDDTADVGMSDYSEATQQTAAALASRVFFHLEEPRQALRLALESGSDHFNVVSPKKEDEAYVERLVNAAIGEYVKKRRVEFDTAASSTTTAEEEKDAEEDEDELDMDKLQTVVHLMFERCYQDGHYSHALGVAFESMEQGKVEEILGRLLQSNDADVIVTTLKYALYAAQTLISSKNFRGEALTLVASTLEQVLQQKFNGEYSSNNAKEVACTLVLCRQILGDAEAVGKIITSLIDASEASGGEDDMALLGLQLCFDIVDSGDEAFVTKVAQCLPNPGSSSDESSSNDDVKRSEATQTHFTNAHRVLTGGFTSELSLSFLYKTSNFDPLIMTNLKKALEERSMSRNSVLHNCAVTAHGYLVAGTTNDSFLRDNLDWMKKASNWYVG